MKDQPEHLGLKNVKDLKINEIFKAKQYVVALVIEHNKLL